MLSFASSVASWAVFPLNWAVFFVTLRDFFAVAGCSFLGCFLEKKILSKSIVFVNFAEVVRFVFT